MGEIKKVFEWSFLLLSTFRDPWEKNDKKSQQLADILEDVKQNNNINNDIKEEYVTYKQYKKYV